MLTYREMKDARDAEVAARNAKDAERMARIYRPAGDDGKAFCAGMQRFESVPARRGKLRDVPVPPDSNPDFRPTIYTRVMDGVVKKTTRRAIERAAGRRP